MTIKSKLAMFEECLNQIASHKRKTLEVRLAQATLGFAEHLGRHKKKRKT